MVKNTSSSDGNINYLAIKEREAIEKVLAIFNGNISKAAKNLGISRNTLYAKIKTYDIEVV
jgi:transcriptional regulator of acetoin/glycerol metabolism